MKRKLRRIAAFALTALLTGSMCEGLLINSRAAVAAQAIETPLDYIASLLAQACGLDFGPTGNTLLMFGQMQAINEAYAETGGSLEDMEGYMHDKAINGELGSFMETLAKESDQSKFSAWLNSAREWCDLQWGDTASLSLPGAISGGSMVSGLKSWLETFDAYGTGETKYRENYAAEWPVLDTGNYTMTDIDGKAYAGRSEEAYSTKKRLYKYYFFNAPSSEINLDDYCAYVSNSDAGTCRVVKKGSDGYVGFTRKPLLYDLTSGSYGLSSGLSSSTTDTFIPISAIAGLMPIFSSRESAAAWAAGSGNPSINYPTRYGVNAKAANKDMQNAAIKQVAGAIDLPGSKEEAQEKANGINLGGRLGDVIKALGALGLGIDVGIDVPDETEKPTTGETDATDATDATDDGKAWEKQVIIRLEEIIAGVEAIPKEIANFFTIDMDAVFEAMNGLKEKLFNKFELLFKLVEIFRDAGRSFSDTPPVFKMQTPDCLRFAFKDDYIVVMDLTPYAEWFVWVRGLLAAMMWVAFGKWCIEQFDVVFHVG